jgi:L-asparagine transporter-like permease
MECTTAGKSFTVITSAICIIPTLIALLSASCSITGCDQPPTEESKKEGYKIISSVVSLWVTLILIIVFMSRICDNVYLKWALFTLFVLLIISIIYFMFFSKPTTQDPLKKSLNDS